MSMKITLMPGAYEGNCIECGKHFIRRQIDSYDDGAFCSECYREFQRKYPRDPATGFYAGVETKEVD